ncbi:filamentous hemagglutinin N-terminal domain-containing protein [Pantanalinema rosaneae CENA516]|uniref:two-partner secretion domain-containing protein n=1 Tax=Pantanalinema rosaneae TaxID=1620701 RepID=UPI003D6F3DE3
MLKAHALCPIWLTLWMASIGMSMPAIAQITPDGTLSTTVSPTGNDFTITAGDRVGNNLFHSFNQFSVPTGGSAFFNNAVDVQNIISRVTGGSLSNIDGLIRANGRANLFLLNPSGILFGPNARLNLGGSFIATTATSIRFADGIEFSATNATTAPLLTISVPIGLQMGSNPAAIAVQGTGHAVTSGTILAPFIRNPSASELRVQPGNTLALVGGNLTLTGATLNAPEGRIELGSLSAPGQVSLTPISQGYQLGYEPGQRFGDIQLMQKSLLTVGALPSLGAFNAGSMQLQGRRMQFSDGSMVLSSNLGSLPGGEMLLQASEAIVVVGASPDASITTGIRSEALNTGKGSAIRLIAPRFILAEGAGINTTAYRFASSGNIAIEAGSVEVSGSSTINPTGVTSLTTSSRSAKSAGNLSITSNRLLVSGGAAISSVTFAAGSTGQVRIRSTDTTITGDNFAGLYSNISAITYGTGKAQTLTLDTARLQVLNGGAIATTSWVIGEAGNVNVNATESIFISGRSPGNNSSINSAVIRPEPLLQRAFDLPNVLSANAGTVQITTPTLTLTNGGTVSVTNQGTGNGGKVQIVTNRLFLDRQGSIQAQTASGESGDLTLQVRDLMLLRHNSLISATSGGIGNGGNITITSPVIVGVENSDIIANAFQGRGGNIQITTQSLLGLQFRPQLTPDNDITASSQFGVSGTVQVNTLNVDPSSGLVVLPETVVDPAQQIVADCSGKPGSRFVATGRGGVPQNPTQQVTSDRTWGDLRDLSVYRHSDRPVAQAPIPAPMIVEVTGWQRDADGTIALVAQPSPATMPHFINCSGQLEPTAAIPP